jgi:SpoVK/Ycf46/Vps4 family AAA+-type ATPase
MTPERLRQLFQNGYNAVRVITYEEPEACEAIIDASTGLGLTPCVWSAVTGLRWSLTADSLPIPETTNAGAALRYLVQSIDRPTLCIFNDLADHLEDKLVLRALRELIEHLRELNTPNARAVVFGAGSRLVMIDHRAQVPGVVEFLTHRHDPLPPDEDEIERIARRTIRSINSVRPIDVESMSKRTFDLIVANLRGLTRRQVAQVIAQAVADDRFCEKDVELVIGAKRRLVSSTGVLEFVDAPASLNDIGGMVRVKRWLAMRADAFNGSGRSQGLPPPRGILLLGVQGAGKSLAAKACAAALRRPLLRLDPGCLFDKYIGESERKLREALQQAEMLSPVILWIDEIEKGFASAASHSNDGGLSRRMLGTLLTWMQEHTSPVFLVATANDIESLPPEMLRKGRFDEIFFVDLPTDEIRRVIFGIHLRRRAQSLSDEDIARCAAVSEGYSGAEIEQAIQAAMFEAASAKRPLNADDVIDAVRASPPLSVTMREKVHALRQWAVGRCVPAD